MDTDLEFRAAFKKHLEVLNIIRNITDITDIQPVQMTLIHCKGKQSKPAINLREINNII